MTLSHNQMAYAAILSTMMFGAMFVGVSGYMQTDSDIGGYEDQSEGSLDPGDGATSKYEDNDGDGLADSMELSTYGTDPTKRDTDGDGLDDGWEIANGLNPLDDGEGDDDDPDNAETTPDSEAEITEGDPWPDPNDGPHGDPDKDGLTNTEEANLGTDPRKPDSDDDGLNDRWEAMYTTVVNWNGENITMFNPLDGNWNCSMITDDATRLQVIMPRFDEVPGREETFADMHVNGYVSCDAVDDSDSDGLLNYEEERWGTNPDSHDSDGDLLSDPVEIGFGKAENGNIELDAHCGVTLLNTIYKQAPFHDVSGNDGLSWFLEDMDEDGFLNGPGDWDTDGDGMPDGFEHCYGDLSDHPLAGMGADPGHILKPANSSDSFGDWDEDGLSNVEEYKVADFFGADNYTSPWLEDTDSDGMPDGWEATNGLHPRDGANADEDPDRDGWDADGDGGVYYNELENSATVKVIHFAIGDFVSSNETVMTVQITLPGGITQQVPIPSPVTGYVYEYGDNVTVNHRFTSRLKQLMLIVEISEQFTNIMEYNAKDRDGDGIIDGRSTNPLVSDTDGDGLKDGIEVMGWDILVVNKGTQTVRVTSDPGTWDTDADGLSDYREFSELCDQGGNASNADTDGDGLGDYTEAVHGFEWDGEAYSTSPCMFDTDNDGLEDGEEVVEGQDLYVTHANNSDTDDDGLDDGSEVLHVPRPWQNPTNPLVNDTDDDGMLDGWEMQVRSLEDNTNSHSLWVVAEPWLPPNCNSMSQCGLEAGGYLFQNQNQGFILEKQFAVGEMNLSGFALPNNPKCNCQGRWALNPAIGSLKDDTYDVDNDTLANSAEAPDRWNTNPVDDDSDQDNLPDGWEVDYSQKALENGLVDNSTLSAYGARGLMDPSLIDSDFDGINDGEEDADNDGLNRTGLYNRYCPDWDDPAGSNCHIDPNTPDGAKFYNNLENYTNFEEFQNGTNPISNDTDGDSWEDGPEVYHQDHDGDGMATGWEFYFEFDPMDPADKLADFDGDGKHNYCEYYWNTNPNNILSYPGQGQSCNDIE
ncbi:MAG: hypothetical protein QF707_02025 [Candidatus Poseidoniaceae archaeon]|nr:hypothetical protein [Candidatus Poseidoniaceae archaeon]